MDTWDTAQPDRDQPIGDASAMPERRSEGVPKGLPKAGSGRDPAPDPVRYPASDATPDSGPDPAPASAPEAGPETVPDLRRALAAIADHYSAVPQPDLFPKVMARATRIRRRRRAIRAGSATAVLVMAALLGPSMASELGMHGGSASAAPPPSAIVDLTSAYPVPQEAEGDETVALPTPPENALTWPSRGATLPAQAVEVAKSYLVGHGKPAVSKTATTATVTTLWAQVDDDAKTAPQQKARKTWLYVMQGWTNGPDGSPSRAQLMVGDYTQAGQASSMSVYATPVTFSHARPGSADDADDTQQIAELSVWLPQSDRLVVLGAPQTETVLYAKTGGDLVPQKTTDGVAVFPRTRQLVKGHYADTIQVRDAKNVALTPPDAWSAADFALSGAMSLWTSTGAGWATVPPRPAKPAQEPSAEPSAEPSREPTTMVPRPKPTVTGTAAVVPATGVPAVGMGVPAVVPSSGSAPLSGDPGMSPGV